MKAPSAGVSRGPSKLAEVSPLWHAADILTLHHGQTGVKHQGIYLGDMLHLPRAEEGRDPVEKERLASARDNGYVPLRVEPHQDLTLCKSK